MAPFDAATRDGGREVNRDGMIDIGVDDVRRNETDLKGRGLRCDED